MPTNLAIDDALLERALAVGGLKSKRATVDEALREFIARRKRLEALRALGTIELVDEVELRADRKRR